MSNVPSERWAYDPGQQLHGPRARIVEQLAGAREVLDVGCWSGYAGQFLVDRGVSSVDGIEPHATMAARAASSAYRHVFAEPVERVVERLPSGSYDGVVLFDVLEHLQDPWKVLAAAKSWLRPKGLVALSVPNVCFWSVRKDVLLGRFEYERSGILDRTHLRFFTERTLREALEDAGLRPRLRLATGAPFPIMGAPGLGEWAATRWPTLFAVQFAWLCEPIV
jgi:2-polyprenyl-3-methyl-5-hydroxy-6-metoxy-1,4-benzoquinol methylase